MVVVRWVDFAAGTFNDAAVCECLDATFVLAPRPAGFVLAAAAVGADAVVERLDFSGEDAARTPASGLDLGFCSLCASLIGSAALSIPFSRTLGRAMSAELR